jgi:hypothetical protein
MGTLSACAGITMAIPALSGLDDVRSADAKPFTDHSGASLRRQNPIPQILRISLPPAVRHVMLRCLPETYESQVEGAPESPIQVRVKPL